MGLLWVKFYQALQIHKKANMCLFFMLRILTLINDFFTVFLMFWVFFKVHVESLSSNNLANSPSGSATLSNSAKDKATKLEGGSLKSNPADFPSCLPGPFSREKWTFFTSLFLSNFQFKSRILLFDTRIKRPNRIFRLQMTTCLLYFKKAF